MEYELGENAVEYELGEIAEGTEDVSFDNTLIIAVGDDGTWTIIEYSDTMHDSIRESLSCLSQCDIDLSQTNAGLYVTEAYFPPHYCSSPECVCDCQEIEFSDFIPVPYNFITDLIVCIATNNKTLNQLISIDEKVTVDEKLEIILSVTNVNYQTQTLMKSISEKMEKIKKENN